MIILHKNVTGLAILSTCHDIATEARFILEPKWRSINSRPIQIIINGFALDGEDFTWLFRCLADSRCAVSNDIREPAYVRRDGYRWSVYGGYIENKYPEECDDSEVDEESDEGEDIKEKETPRRHFLKRLEESPSIGTSTRSATTPSYVKQGWASISIRLNRLSNNGGTSSCPKIIQLSIVVVLTLYFTQHC
jgi:hypothetical protein